MQTTRAGKYGVNLAVWIDYTISTIKTNDKEEYKSILLKELGSYSFETRKKGTPINSGCVYELKDIQIYDINNPKDLARIVKEGLHLMYQKQTAARAMKSLLETLMAEN